jgi:hypothetical protein
MACICGFFEQLGQVYVVNIASDYIQWPFTKDFWQLPAKNQLTTAPFLECCKYFLKIFQITNRILNLVDPKGIEKDVWLLPEVFGSSLAKIVT